jgi:signal transduction histidine kinase
LLIIWIGLPLAVATLVLGRWFAILERARMRGAGQSLPGATYRVGRGRWGWLVVLRDPQYWLDTLHGIASMPLATFTWSIALIWWLGALAGLSFWFWQPWLPGGADSRSLSQLLGWDGAQATLVLNTALGTFFLVTLVPVIRGCMMLHSGLARLLLGNEQARRLQRRIDTLTSTRTAAVEAEAHALRRLERDLHDGPQQRLIRLGMDLSAAERRLEVDPQAARSLLAAARTQTAEALAELRALSRGIAPPILSDRGLAAALTAVAARCTVQADLFVALPDGGRLPASVEHAAYFVVSEALANVAKHSQATRVHVRVVRHATVVRIEVEDDGIGGAHPAKGHGLAGLADRLAAVDGTLVVTSPPGGPTLVAAELPCA